MWTIANGIGKIETFPKTLVEKNLYYKKGKEYG